MAWDQPDDRGPMAETEPVDEEVGSSSPWAWAGLGAVFVAIAVLLAWLL